MEMDGKEFEQILPLIEKARQSGFWLILAGHEINKGGNQTTRTSLLEKLLPYANNPANRIRLAPVGTVRKICP
jgi:ABC-type Mn2+/Zn2+ transport system ATPase subunit